MKQIELDGMRYPLPETWEDIDAGMLPGLVQQVYMLPESGRVYHEVIRLCLGIPKKRWHKIHQKHFSPKLSEKTRRKNAEVLQQLVSLLSWLWTEPMNHAPFPEINVDGLAWLLPDPDFSTVSYGELTDLYTHLQHYIQQTVPEEEALDWLVATACRPRRRGSYDRDPAWDGDHREPYNEFVVRGRAKQAAALPFETKLAVLLYVASTIKTVMARYALFDVEPSTAGTPDRDKSGGASSSEAYAGQGFVKNQHLLAEKHIFGTLKQTQAANAHEVLLFLEEHRNDLLAKQAAQTDD